MLGLVKKGGTERDAALEGMNEQRDNHVHPVVVHALREPGQRVAPGPSERKIGQNARRVFLKGALRQKRDGFGQGRIRWKSAT